MSSSPLNPNLVPFLQGLKPFLGPKGQNLTDITLNLLKILSSQTTQETVQMLNEAVNKNSSAAQGVASPVDYAFTLFLILILLILSSNVLIPNEVGYNTGLSHGDSPFSDEPIGETT
ncbi:hypothetical protein Tfer_0353 [Thermincola ferriacetica]|uniref:Uncharacterized protein n=1 Tax=Thermincola ferriacetica TaxID=281456 RepID=A0A0L6W567_9FIRM|nr:hypothetical protein [Thermincola ferriacetica]KNZ70675.1 hypothetical protein Tfer_0353 [Thermincola ferriacetica]